jgi:hypothetical protein
MVQQVRPGRSYGFSAAISRVELIARNLSLLYLASATTEAPARAASGRKSVLRLTAVTDPAAGRFP